jgi:RNA polymerase sigma factor (sigma-70 family)
VVHRHFRAKRALKRSGTPPPPELRLISSSEERMEHREGVRRLYEAMSEMPSHYRVAFSLFALDGRSLQGVADAMGVSLVAAKTRVWRARRLLRKAAKADAVLAGYLASAEI